MKSFLCLLTALMFLLPPASFAAADTHDKPAYPKLADGSTQYANFPKPLETYPQTEGGIIETLKARAKADPFNVAASVIFLLAILHTFAASTFTKLSHQMEHDHEEEMKRRGVRDELHPDGVAEVSFPATVLHYLGEVEAVFGMWVIALAGAAVYYHSWHDFILYLAKDRVFTEPLFVFVIMAIAASRPVLRFSEILMSKAAMLGKGSPAAWWLSVLIIAPVLGSFITEPAAMTIGALLLAKRFYRYNPPAKLAYATLGLLFVNISVGGTLTHFAAPPVLMVAGKWGWDTLFMLEHFGWKAIIGVLLSSGLYFIWFRKELFKISDQADGNEDGVVNEPVWNERETRIPAWVTFVHLCFLGWTVYAAHYPVLFIGGFLFFMAFTTATRHHQNRISLKSPLLVGFFLAGLVVHGGCQAWWIAPVIMALPNAALMLGSTVLTAFNDNAAITYLASQVEGLSLAAKHAVVAGAVTGGGLTVIANAPNPAGQSILSKHFKDGISPLGLLLGALIPTIIVYLCFIILPNGTAKEHPPEIPAVEQTSHP
ncbi:MAG: putative Na+/H+ antiporter [Luteolibacter sp.]|uniref:putative Na+/H+ antiporter n=1 Tax=Luteolibacter sp. TaxID=1962973 RepID=UPI003264A706